ncbi:MAG: ammonium transporter [Microcoleaceae cyanobacterium]
MRFRPWIKPFTIAAGIAIFSAIFSSASPAQDLQSQLPCSAVDPATTNTLENAVNNLWVLVAAVLVLSMLLGFAMLEAGFNAAKNTVNVLFKNVADACLGIIIYFAFGYALMYRPEVTCESAYVLGIPGFMGISLPYIMLDTLFPRDGAEHLSVYIDFFFQAAFAATTTTICSGAIAGRIKPWAYLVLTVIITGLVYPISGYWIWGGGWLGTLGLHDFSGALGVHALGGGAALAVVLILKPRAGKFGDWEKLSKAEENHLSGHSLPLAAIGMFVLWLGWYGFNVGSALGIIGDVNLRSPEILGRIALNTTISACSSALTVMVYRWFRNRCRIDLSSVLNGILGGLVAITAACDVVSPPQSLIIGIFAGLIVIGGVNLLFVLKIDDAVGAIPVHGLCGMWGGLAVGCFGIANINLGIQIIGVLLIPAWAFGSVWLLLSLLNSLSPIRVSEEEEIGGLDWSEHGEYAYLSLETQEGTDEYI